MAKKKNMIIVSVVGAVILVAVLLFFNMSSQQSQNQSSDVQNVQVEQNEAKVQSTELTVEEKAYKELIGNLHDVINPNEKAQVQSLIAELVKIESNGDETEINKIYKDIIKILDEVTLRSHDKKELEKYKEIYNSFNKANESNIDIESIYKIQQNGSITSLGSSEPIHFEMWEKAKKILPFELIKDIPQFVTYKVDKTKGSYSPGFMGQVAIFDEKEKWALGVASNVDDETLPYILTHEFGHYISLRGATAINMNNSLKNKLTAEGNKLLSDFLTECLGHIAQEFQNIDENNHYLFYARHKDDFVTCYAATNVCEDFAESFAHFVISSTYESETLTRKMNFFNSSPELVEMKNQILNNMKNNNMGEIKAATTVTMIN